MLKYVRDDKFNRYAVVENGSTIAYVHGGRGYWRAYQAPNGIVREGRTRDIAVARIRAATGSK